MAGVKGQRSGGHNAKSFEEHQRNGTVQSCRVSGYAGKESHFVSEFQKLCGDVQSDVKTLYEIWKASAKIWESDPANKDARMSATAALDRVVRIVAAIASEKPEEPPPDPQEKLKALIEARKD